MNADVSIIIPALNEASGIADAVERASALAPREVIVVDGGSHDGTARIAADRGCHVVESQPGRAVQQNAGAGAASGATLLFLHADNWLAADALLQIREVLADEAVLAGAFRQRIEASGWIYRWLEWGNAVRARRLGLPYGDQAIFVRREVFERVGGFPPMALMEDLYLMKQLRRRSWPVLLRGPLYVSARRWRRYGVLRQTFRNWSLLAAARLGVSPSRLANYYRPHFTNGASSREMMSGDGE